MQKPAFRRHLKGLNPHQRTGRSEDLTQDMVTEVSDSFVAGI